MLEDTSFGLQLIRGFLEAVGYLVRNIYYLFFAGSYKEADKEYQKKRRKAIFGYVFSPNQLTGLITIAVILLLVLFLNSN